MFNRPVVFVDIETTGGTSQRSKIIEVSALKWVDGQIVDVFSSLVNPGTHIPEMITSITGISRFDVEDAPYFEDIGEKLHGFLDGSMFIAHNVIFDYSFIHKQLGEIGLAYQPDLFCTVKLSRYLYPQARSHSLQNIIQRHQIEVAQRHRSYDDALAMVKFCQIAVTEHGPERFNQAVQAQFKLRSLPPNVDQAQIDILPREHGVYIFKDKNKLPIYVGKSIRVRSRVLSHFTDSKNNAKELNIALESHHIEAIPARSELEALLLESQLVKQLMPKYNRMLRKKKLVTALMASTDEGGYITISKKRSQFEDYESTAGTLGVFTSAQQANKFLESAQRAHQLCPKLLGLEKSKAGCFLSQLQMCKGACIGKEFAVEYNQRVEEAFAKSKIDLWPYEGPVLIREKASSDFGVIVDNWTITAVLKSVEENEPFFEATDALFDIDTYKILYSYLQKNKSRLMITPTASRTTWVSIR